MTHLKVCDGWLQKHRAGAISDSGVARAQKKIQGTEICHPNVIPCSQRLLVHHCSYVIASAFVSQKFLGRARDVVDPCKNIPRIYRARINKDKLITALCIVKLVMRSRGGGSPDEARLEQTPYTFHTQLIWRYLGIK